jgi:hypothetical protein
MAGSVLRGRRLIATTQRKARYSRASRARRRTVARGLSAVDTTRNLPVRIRRKQVTGRRDGRFYWCSKLKNGPAEGSNGAVRARQVTPRSTHQRGEYGEVGHGVNFWPHCRHTHVCVGTWDKGSPSQTHISFAVIRPQFFIRSSVCWIDGPPFARNRLRAFDGVRARTASQPPSLQPP